MSMIEVRELTKSFGLRQALAKINWQVAEGQCVVLAGPNGAGKTTLLHILATLTRPTTGTVRIAGLDPAKDGLEVRRRLGFLSHRLLLYEDLTAEQNLNFYARMYDLPHPAARISELLQGVGLASRRHDLVRTYSRGMQQRLAVARAVLHRPQLLLLDEPYTGLDLRATQMLSDLLARLAEEGCTILFTTHALEQGLALGQRVVVLVRGQIVYDALREVIDAATFAETYAQLTL